MSVEQQIDVGVSVSSQGESILTSVQGALDAMAAQATGIAGSFNTLNDGNTKLTSSFTTLAAQAMKVTQAADDLKKAFSDMNAAMGTPDVDAQKAAFKDLETAMVSSASTLKGFAGAQDALTAAATKASGAAILQAAGIRANDIVYLNSLRTIQDTTNAYLGSSAEAQKYTDQLRVQASAVDALTEAEKRLSAAKTAGSPSRPGGTFVNQGMIDQLTQEVAAARQKVASGLSSLPQLGSASYNASLPTLADYAPSSADTAKIEAQTNAILSSSDAETRLAQIQQQRASAQAELNTQIDISARLEAAYGASAVLNAQDTLIAADAQQKLIAAAIRLNSIKQTESKQQEVVTNAAKPPLSSIAVDPATLAFNNTEVQRLAALSDKELAVEKTTMAVNIAQDQYNETIAKAIQYQEAMATSADIEAKSLQEGAVAADAATAAKMRLVEALRAQAEATNRLNAPVGATAAEASGGGGAMNMLLGGASDFLRYQLMYAAGYAVLNKAIQGFNDAQNLGLQTAAFAGSLDISGQTAQKYQDAATQMALSGNTSLTPTQILAAAYQPATYGNPNDVSGNMSIVNAAAKLTEAQGNPGTATGQGISQLDLQPAITAIQAILNVYGKGGNVDTMSQSVAATLASVTAVSGYKLPDIAGELPKLAASAHNIGVTYQDLTAALGALSSSLPGNPAQAGQDLNNALTSIAHPTAGQRVIGNEFGYNTGASAVTDAGGFLKYLMQVNKATLDPLLAQTNPVLAREQQSTILNSGFNSTTARVIEELLANPQLQKIFANANNPSNQNPGSSGNVLTRGDQAYNQNPSVQLANSMNKLHTEFEDLASQLVVPGKTIVDSLNYFSDAVKSLADSIKSGTLGQYVGAAVGNIPNKLGDAKDQANRSFGIMGLPTALALPAAGLLAPFAIAGGAIGNQVLSHFGIGTTTSNTQSLSVGTGIDRALEGDRQRAALAAQNNPTFTGGGFSFKSSGPNNGFTNVGEDYNNPMEPTTGIDQAPMPLTVATGIDRALSSDRQRALMRRQQAPFDGSYVPSVTFGANTVLSNSPVSTNVPAQTGFTGTNIQEVFTPDATSTPPPVNVGAQTYSNKELQAIHSQIEANMQNLGGNQRGGLAALTTAQEKVKAAINSGDTRQYLSALEEVRGVVKVLTTPSSPGGIPSKSVDWGNSFLAYSVANWDRQMQRSIKNNTNTVIGNIEGLADSDLSLGDYAGAASEANQAIALQNKNYKAEGLTSGQNDKLVLATQQAYIAPGIQDQLANIQSAMDNTTDPVQRAKDRAAELALQTKNARMLRISPVALGNLAKQYNIADTQDTLADNQNQYTSAIDSGNFSLADQYQAKILGNINTLQGDGNLSAGQARLQKIATIKQNLDAQMSATQQDIQNAMANGDTSMVGALTQKLLGQNQASLNAGTETTKTYNTNKNNALNQPLTLDISNQTDAFNAALSNGQYSAMQAAAAKIMGDEQQQVSLGKISEAKQKVDALNLLKQEIDAINTDLQNQQSQAASAGDTSQVQSLANQIIGNDQTVFSKGGMSASTFRADKRSALSPVYQTALSNDQNNLSIARNDGNVQLAQKIEQAIEALNTKYVGLGVVSATSAAAQKDSFRSQDQADAQKAAQDNVDAAKSNLQYVTDLDSTYKTRSAAEAAYIAAEYALIKTEKLTPQERITANQGVADEDLEYKQQNKSQDLQLRQTIAQQNLDFVEKYGGTVQQQKTAFDEYIAAQKAYMVSSDKGNPLKLQADMGSLRNQQADFSQQQALNAADLNAQTAQAQLTFVQQYGGTVQQQQTAFNTYMKAVEAEQALKDRGKPAQAALDAATNKNTTAAEGQRQYQNQVTSLQDQIQVALNNNNDTLAASLEKQLGAYEAKNDIKNGTIPGQAALNQQDATMKAASYLEQPFLNAIKVAQASGNPQQLYQADQAKYQYDLTHASSLGMAPTDLKVEKANLDKENYQNGLKTIQDQVALAKATPNDQQGVAYWTEQLYKYEVANKGISGMTSAQLGVDNQTALDAQRQANQVTADQNYTAAQQFFQGVQLQGGTIQQQKDAAQKMYDAAVKQIEAEGLTGQALTNALTKAGLDNTTTLQGINNQVVSQAQEAFQLGQAHGVVQANIPQLQAGGAEWIKAVMADPSTKNDPNKIALDKQTVQDALDNAQATQVQKDIKEYQNQIALAQLDGNRGAADAAEAQITQLETMNATLLNLTPSDIALQQAQFNKQNASNLGAGPELINNQANPTGDAFAGYGGSVASLSGPTAASGQAEMIKSLQRTIVQQASMIAQLEGLNGTALDSKNIQSRTLSAIQSGQAGGAPNPPSKSASGGKRQLGMAR